MTYLETIRLASAPDLTPLALHRDGRRLRFVLRTQDDIMEQLPPNYEEVLTERLAGILSDPTDFIAEVDLEDVAAISSRQLGSMIALSKVLRPRFGPLPLRRVSEGVRYLLEMTRTNALFKYE